MQICAWMQARKAGFTSSARMAQGHRHFAQRAWSPATPQRVSPRLKRSPTDKIRDVIGRAGAKVIREICESDRCKVDIDE